MIIYLGCERGDEDEAHYLPEALIAAVAPSRAVRSKGH